MQPVKSVLLEILPTLRGQEPEEADITLKGQPMPVVQETMHMDILRSANSQESAVEENFKKARRTIYALMATGLHGENGLNPETSFQLTYTYILPILVYGLEVVLPNRTLMDKLERVYKKFLKQVLSLPDTVADPAVYVLTGTIPIETVVHKRALTLFGSICRLGDDSVEKQLARRQLSIKSFSSHSWYIAIRKLLIKYDLQHPWDLLDDQPTKTRWKATVNKGVNEYWCSTMREKAALCPFLQYLNTEDYMPGRKHWLIQHTKEVREVTSLKTKLKLVTGSYVLRVNRACFNQNQVNRICMICNTDDETIDHFLLNCNALAETRRHMLDRLVSLADSFLQSTQDSLQIFRQLFLDCNKITDSSASSEYQSQLRALERQSVSLCHALHTERYKRLSLISKRKR